MVRTPACFVALFTALCPAAWAQSVTGSISGTVLDAAGAVISSAKVRITSDFTGASRETSTDGAGNFSFNALQPGKFTLLVEHPGFRNERETGIELTPGQDLTLPEIKLQVGSTSETVSVSADAVAVQIASGERSGTISSKEVENLTLINRDFSALVGLMPGVVLNPGAEVQGFGGGASFNVQGGRSISNNITIDGASTDNTNGGAGNNNVSMDSVQTVEIKVSSFQAEFGRKPGAAIMAVTKSGTQQFHGALYYYKRHEEFNANDFFNNKAGLSKAPYRYTTVGGNIGGPLVIPHLFNTSRQKLFFFASAEYIQEARPQAIRQLTVPTEAERRGDFSRNPYYAPDSTDPNALKPPYTVNDPVANKTPFPGNIIPASRFDLNGQRYLSLLPLPNVLDPKTSLSAYNFQTQESLRIPKNLETVKIDYPFSDKMTIYARYNRWWENQQGWAVSAGNSNWGWLPSTYNNFTNSFVLSSTRILSPALILESQATYQRWGEMGPPLNQAAVDRVSRTATGITIPQFHPENNVYNVVPAASFSGPTNAISTAYTSRFPLRGIENTYTLSSTLTYTHGAHTSKFGVFAEQWRAVKGEQGTFAGSIAFNRDGNNPYDTNDPFANALIGSVDSYTESSTRPPTYENATGVEGYAQDNWKISRRLTLDFGVRLGWSTPFASPRRQESGFNPAYYSLASKPVLIRPTLVETTRMGVNPVTGQILPAALIGAFAPNVGNPFDGMVVLQNDQSYPGGLRNNTGLSAAPRFGFAFDPFGKGTTAIRGGFGIFYEVRDKDIWSYNLAINPPQQLNPIIYYTTLTTFLGQPGYVFPSGTVTGLDRNRILPQTMNFNLGVQRSIGGVVVDVSYVGAMGRHLTARRDLNATPLGTNFLPSSLDASNKNAPLPANFLRPYTGAGSILYYTNDTNSDYHSLQVSVRRQLNRRISGTLAYTWSKARDYADNESTTLSTFIDNHVWNWGLAGFDRTQILVSSFIYSMPQLRGSSRLVRGVLSDWQLSGIMSFQSGAPTGIGLSFNYTHDVTGSTDGARVNVVGDPNVNVLRFYAFNVDALAPPAVGTWGNANRVVFRGPGVANIDSSLFKNFRIAGERWKGQLRGEFYNVFNHTQFSGVNTDPKYNASGQATNALFGTYTSARQPRRIQLALRVTF